MNQKGVGMTQNFFTALEATRVSRYTLQVALAPQPEFESAVYTFGGSEKKNPFITGNSQPQS